MNCAKERELEKQRYGRNKSTAINHAYINSGEYRNKFNNLSDNEELNRIVYKIKTCKYYEEEQLIIGEAYVVFRYVKQNYRNKRNKERKKRYNAPENIVKKIMLFENSHCEMLELNKHFLIYAGSVFYFHSENLLEFYL